MPKEILAILYFAGTVLVTVVATVLLCRHRRVIKKKSFYLIAFLGMVTVNIIFPVSMILAGRIYAEGLRAFSSEAWKGLHSFESPASDAMLLGFFGILFCILPAVAVAYHYDKRSKRNEAGMDSQAT